VVSRLSTGELRAAAGMADSTYRRARAALLESGEVAIEAAGGGRAKTNRWVLRDPRSGNPEPVLVPRGRVAPNRTARPLLATVIEPDAADRREPAVAPAAIANGPGSSGVSGANPAENQTISAGNSPGLSGVSVRNPAQCRTVWRQTPPETPPQTPPLYVRAGREPQNPRTFPPQPPDGGSSGEQVSIVEDYITDRGRKRQRTVVVELAAIRHQLRAASDGDLADWERIRSELRVLVGESTFEIWLAQLELAATDPGGRLVLAAPASTRSWVAHRFARAFDHAGVVVDRSVRLADERELQLLAALATSPSPAAAPAPDVLPRSPHQIPHKEAV
jgi:DnaA N-terminal domain